MEINQAHNYAGLSALCRGERATVQELTVQGPMRRRLQDLGLIAGTQVECLGESPLGDPRAYLVRGAVIALRRQDAEGVLMGPVERVYPAQAGLAGEALDHGAL